MPFFKNKPFLSSFFRFFNKHAKLIAAFNNRFSTMEAATGRNVVKDYGDSGVFTKPKPAKCVLNVSALIAKIPSGVAKLIGLHQPWPP